MYTACYRSALRCSVLGALSRARCCSPSISRKRIVHVHPAFLWVARPGGLYAMFAIGLALIFGIMRLVNIAHGDLIVLSAYIALIVTQTLGLNPLLALVIVIPVMAIVGYGLQRGLFNRTMGADVMPSL